MIILGTVRPLTITLAWIGLAEGLIELGVLLYAAVVIFG